MWCDLVLYACHSWNAPLRGHNENWPKMGSQQKPWFTIYRIVYTSPFFSSSNGRISGTKRARLDPLAPKRPQRAGLSSPLSWKWPRPTLSSSFGLFLERKHFFGVFQLGQIGPLWSKTCPWDPYPSCKKEPIPASPIDRLPECFVIFLIAARSRSRINNLESKSKWPSMAPLEHHEIVNVCSLDNRRPISGNSCNGV